MRRDSVQTATAIAEQVSAIALTRPTGLYWWAGFSVSLALLLLLTIAIGTLFIAGVGIWGIDMPVAWGLAIVNYVWWIAIASGGTLISAIFYLLGSEWRTPITRIAESMMVFAAACAGLFPILHLGRPWLFFWLFPYPATMQTWPQFRSPLLWDFVAIMVYVMASVLFWYLGLLPDLATLRDRATGRFAQFCYGLAALGWRGSAQHWRHYRVLYLLFAGLLTPTVVSIHSIVGLDFAAGMTPGWHSTEFPPFFVFGAMLSGFGMVTALVIVIRRFYGLANLITPHHLDILAMMLLASSVAIGYAYAMEVFAELYSADVFHHHTVIARLIGPFAPFFWATVLLNVCVPQLLWSRVLRRAPMPLFAICIAVMIGMWIERYLLVVTSLAQDFMPSAFGSYWPTFWDWATTLGSFGLFFTGIFLFLRFLPIVAMSEMSAMRREREKRA